MENIKWEIKIGKLYLLQGETTKDIILGWCGAWQIKNTYDNEH